MHLYLSFSPEHLPGQSWRAVGWFFAQSTSQCHLQAQISPRSITRSLTPAGFSQHETTCLGLSIFVLSREKWHLQGHWIHSFRFYFSYFGFFFPIWDSLNVNIYKRRGFFSVLEAIIRDNCDKQPWIKNGEDLAVHASTWPSGVEKYRIFPRVLLRLFSGLQILVEHCSLYDKILFSTILYL